MQKVQDRLSDQEKEDLIAGHYKSILELLGEDVNREGLEKTPIRVARAMKFLTSGYSQSPEEILRSAIFHENYGDSQRIVLVKDIEFYSLCEHHLLPFFGKVHIGYMPGDKIVGLSKPARLVDAFARRFQVQERMTREILDCFDSVIEPYGTIVMVEARHLCMQMRGVEKQNASTTTCLYSGNFKDRELREKFFSMLRNR